MRLDKGGEWVGIEKDILVVEMSAMFRASEDEGDLAERDFPIDLMNVIE